MKLRFFKLPEMALLDMGAIKLVGRAAALVWRSGPIWTATNALVVLMEAVLPLLFLFVLKGLIDTASAMMNSSSQDASFGDLMWWIVIASGITLLQAAVGAASTLAGDAQAQAVTDHVADIIHAKSLAADLEYYENAEYRDSMHRAQREASYRPRAIVGTLLGLAGSAIGLLTMVGVLFTFHWAVVPILIVASLPGGYLRLKFARHMYEWRWERTPLERLVGYYGRLITETVFAKEVRLFDLGRHFREKCRDARDELRQERLGFTIRRSWAEFAGDAAAVLGTFSILVLIGYQAFLGAITIGGLAMYFHALNQARGRLGEFLRNTSQLYENYLFLVDFFRFVDLAPKIRDPKHPKPLIRPMTEGIVFEHVSFRYPNAGDFVLKDICMTIRPGEHVAFVGLNGAGKTTLVKLLCRLYDPTEGKISIDGIDLRELDRQDMRRGISAILQDFGKYQLSARDNIWFGNLGLDKYDDRIPIAAQQAGAHDFIEVLDQGYETNLGTMLPGARDLSHGQWQSVALARTILRDAQILILDEPTASLDPQAEQDFFMRFHQLAKDRTTILISHRSLSLTIVDNIFVLDHGRIVEHGPHQELLRRKGLYTHLFEMQARQYGRPSAPQGV